MDIYLWPYSNLNVNWCWFIWHLHTSIIFRMLKIWGAFKKKRAGGLGTETSSCMSEVLALAVEALAPLRHKTVNVCLIKFPGLRCEPVPHVLLDVVWGESFAPQSPFWGTKNDVIAGREVWTVWRVTALDDWRMLLLGFSRVTCTRDPLAADSELPRSCWNHSLLHTQRYCHRFSHSRLRLVSLWTSPARLFFNVSGTFLFKCPL